MDWQILVPFIPFFASFFGVLTAFGLNRWWENCRKQEAARKLIPYIYFEMNQNLQLAEECLHQNGFYREAKRFEVSHWQMFRFAFRDLAPVSISMLIKIYYHLMRANRLLDEGAQALDAKVNSSAQVAKQLINDQLNEFDKWFKKDKRAMKARQEVEQQWTTIGKYDPEVKQVLPKTEERFKKTLKQLFCYWKEKAETAKQRQPADSSSPSLSLLSV